MTQKRELKFEDEVWKSFFTYLFFRFTQDYAEKNSRKGSFTNPTLHKLAQETLKKQIDFYKKEIENLERLKETYHKTLS